MNLTLGALRILVAVVIVLAVSLVLTVPRPMALSGEEHAHSSAPAMSAGTQDEHATSHVRSVEAKSIRCGPSTSDCCVMALCHPGLAPENGASLVRSRDGVGTAVVPRGAIGSEADVDVPPPRLLPV